jgi:hypothetical protein
LRVAGRSRPLSICRTWMQEAWVEAGSAPS